VTIEQAHMTWSWECRDKDGGEMFSKENPSKVEEMKIQFKKRKREDT